MNLISLAKYGKALVWIIAIGGVIVLSVSSYAGLPKKVEKVEAKVDEQKDHIQGVASSLDTYIKMNESYKKQQMEHQKTLIELLKK